MNASSACSSARVPPSPNTASVHEHRCLYSHDIRRKSKRWQDGFVKFHAFNKRVMVYDEARNFLGDTHWKEQGELQAEDEVTLDIGVLVQVGEILATSQTNLAPLFERERKKLDDGEVEGNGDRNRNWNGLSTAARTTLGGRTNAAAKVFKKHMSLNALLGTPKGAIGRSTVPAKSPYEIKNDNNENEWEDNHNVKRRKIDQPWSVTRVSKEMPWARTSDARKEVSQMSRRDIPLAGQAPLVVQEIIDITSDYEGFSDVTIPSTPAREPALISKIATKPPAPRIPKSKATPRREAPSSPPVSAKNHLKVVDTGTTVENTKSRGAESIVKDTSLHDAEEHPPSLQRPKPAPKTKPLRIARSQPRSMLLCQASTQATAGSSQPVRKTQNNRNAAKSVQPEAELTLLETLVAARKPQVDPFACLTDSDDDVVLSKVVPKKTQPKTKDTEARETASGLSKSRTAALASDGTNRSSSPAFSTLPPRPERFEPMGNSAAPASLHPPTARRRQISNSDMEVMHGLMDQQIFSPPDAQTPTLKITSLALLPQPKPTTRTPFLPPQEPTARAPLPAPPKSTGKAPILAPSKPAVKSPFRRVQSESNADFAIDIISSPIDELEPVPAVLRSSQEELLRKVQTRSKKPPRRPLQRSMSLATGTNEKAKATARAKAKRMGPVPVPEKKTETGPWTIEATDLFDWRPPDWEERVKKRKAEFGY
ncbi:hypothetical protein E2P81_ATG08330 [Venturia nashicola]|uniref:5'-3' DNA helicase ZGRF1-like N-terminal domain-containing protein n=1 Tax=Venturia nashicola TaxID=86259 RepID=A0A4Z1NQJ9_9PEZI|nr:hypothetical protein E6O75_ATG08518 [Venturia nashicola]TLD21742.1 hypothetical protein E2P81_ATG08330 [Venturia nashicola]